MTKTMLARVAGYFPLIAIVTVIAGCGGGLSGYYADETGLMKFNFKPGHKVEMENPFGGGSVEFDYQIKDKALRINMPQGMQVYPFTEHGCFMVTFVGKVCKVKG